MKTLKIYEIDYSVSPGGVNFFEVYDEPDETYNELEYDPNNAPIFESESLLEACQFCYNLGYNFTVYTLAEWVRSNEVPLIGVKW